MIKAIMTISITPYVVVAPLIAFFFIVYAWNHVVRGTKTVWEAILWSLFWGGITIIVLFPGLIGFLTTWTGIKDQANAVFAIILGIILFVIFHMIVRMEKIQKQITDLIRHDALEDAGVLDEIEN